MSKNISQKTIHQLEEFNRNGFIRSNASSKYAINILRLSPKTRLFRTTITKSKGSTRYSTFDIFRCNRMQFIYDTQRVDSFLEYLESLFIGVNSNPEEPLRRAFTKLLSSNYLISKDYNERLKRDEQKTINNTRLDKI